MPIRPKRAGATAPRATVRSTPPRAAPRPSAAPRDSAPRTAPRRHASRAPWIQRELSLLEFNRRVLEQARDPSLPLLERLRFLTICSTNLDEFFEIRVAGLKQQLAHDLPSGDPTGLTPAEILRRVSATAHDLVAAQYRVLNEDLLPALATERIRLVRRSRWTASQARWTKRTFVTHVLPVLTPMALDPAHPFPRVLNKGLDFIVMLAGKDAYGRSISSAIVQVPRSLPRVWALPPSVANGDHDFVLLSSIIHAHVAELFPGMNVLGCYQFRVTRNSDLWVDEEEVGNLMQALKGELPHRNFGDAVRLEVVDTCPPDVHAYLLTQVGLGPEDLYAVNGPVNLHRLEALHEQVDRPDLKFHPFVPGIPRKVKAATDLFELLRRQDVLLHHPYEGLSPVVQLVQQAAADPAVLAIRQTLYRVGGPESPFVEALIEAARAGKEVTVVVELRARFDEAANIDLATRLQEVGANVVYGIVGFKAHAKMLLVVRREGRHLRRYVHLGTGNYHAGTARAYTDLGLMTADRHVAEDVHRLFLQLTGIGKARRLKRLVQSPFSLQERLLELVEQEAQRARKGGPARIMAKLNSLSDPTIIAALESASQAGVEIDLIVRGVCCLRPGVPGVSERIRVRSIVGRFLEHSRVYYFHAGGRELTFCGSADWMTRNFLRRVEVCFPIQDPRLRARVITEALAMSLADTAQSWLLQPDGTYKRVKPGRDKQRPVQEVLLVNLAEPAKRGRGRRG